MRHPALALAACLAVTGSIAHAEPHRRARHHGKAHTKPTQEAAAEPTEHRDEVDAELVDEPERPRHHLRHRDHDWHLAIGPNVWASSVDATVSLGSKTVTTGIDFLQMEHHARYGVPLLAEARHGRFSLVTDLTYGVVDIAGGKSVGPLMVALDGSASSLMVDGLAGYRVAGDEHSPFSLEARGGIRYQRTAVSASLGIDGATATSYGSVTDGMDALAGARVFVRPSSSFFLTGTADIGLFGSSSRTWSAAADASVRITSHVMLSAGWRTLTTESAAMQLVMYGPRVSLQALF